MKAKREEAALRLAGITCSFESRVRSGQSYTAIQNVDLEVAEGEFVSIVGPTGSGKSTILNVAAGLIKPTLGDVHVFDRPLHGINEQAGYLFQADCLMPWKTALEGVMVGLLYHGVARAEAVERSLDWLVRVGLKGFEDRYPHQLSGGMRKRVALAQTLILDPKIILMDEPFSALDVQTRQLMENELLDLWSADRKSVVFITHDLEEAIALSDRVLVLSAGPGAHLIGDFKVTLERPRDVSEIRMTPAFLELHKDIWHTLKEEVLKGYEQSRKG